MSELPRSNRRLWVATLATALTFLLIDSVARMRAITELTERAGGGPRSAAIDPASPSGLEGNQHLTVVPHIGMDGYHWVMQTQQMLSGHGLRVRHVAYDGPREGRPVHWSASLHWLAAVAARVESALTGRPVSLAVEDVFTWANTALCALLLIALVVVCARRFGSVAASLIAIGAVATYPTYEFLLIGNFDHHGLAAFAAVGTVLTIAGGGAGWIQSGSGKGHSRLDRSLGDWLPDSRHARMWFIASGVSGGVGLWVSAATEVPTLIGIGVGALLCAVLVRRDDDASRRPDPSVWRVWGISGAITSCALYAMEYFPSNMGLHLEVNHPLYAVAWLGAGDFMFRVFRTRSTGAKWTSDLAGLVVDVLLVASVPVTALMAGESFILRPGSFIVGLHEDYITEFRPLTAQVGTWTVGQLMAGVGLLLPLVLLPAGAVALNKRVPAPIRSMLIIALLPTIAFGAWALMQGRWLGMSTSLSLCVLVALAFASELTVTWTRPRLLTAGALLALAFAPFPVLTISRWSAREGAYPPSAADLAQVVTRDVAQKLRMRLGNERGVVASGPTTTTWMTWFGGLKGVGSLYWENAEGLRQSARLFGAPLIESTGVQQDSAYALVRRLGVTHVVLYSWNAFATEYARLALGLRGGATPTVAEQKRIDESFGLRLMQGAIPTWLRPLPYRVPAVAGSDASWALVLEVAPNQSPEEAATYSAQYCLAMNDEDTAVQQLGIALDARPAYVPALVTLARIQAANPRRGDYRTTLQRLQRALGDRDTVALEDRIGLATLYVTTGDTAAGRAMVRRAIEQANELAIRRLPWDYTAANFIVLARQLGLMDLRPDIMELVLRTLDPSVRTQLGR